MGYGGSSTALPYTYRARGRSPLNVAALILACVFFAFAVVWDAPTLMLIPVGLCAAGLAWMVARDPKDALTVDDAGVVVVDPEGERRMYTPEIATVRIREWTDGSDVEIRLTSGETVTLSARLTPPVRRLTEALEAAGVAVSTE